MNQVSGFAFAALVVSPARLKPVVTMTSYFWSTKSWMSLAYSDASFGMTGGGFAAPIAAAPSSAPLYVYSLKFLSSTEPMSRTTPIFRFELADAAADAGADSEAAGAEAGAFEAAAVDGLAPPPPVHAATRMARPPNNVGPRERLCIYPPPASRSLCGRTVRWSVTVSKERSPRRATF